MEIDNKKKQIFRTVFGVLLASAFLYLTLKGKDLGEIWQTIQNANFLYLFLTIIIYLLTFVTRSEKWRIQVENLGYKVFPKTAYFSLMLHYFFNSFTPKFGVIARCGDLKKKNKVPFSACFGSYMSEVVFDFLFLFIGLFIVVIIEFEKIKVVFDKLFLDFKSYFGSHQQFVVYIIIAGFLALAFLYFIRKKIFLRKYNNPIKTFFRAIAKTFNIKKFFLFFVWNIILWILLFLMNYFLFKSLFDDKMSMSFILT
ncbi:MAG: lysylphosphatidylglycerol synthase transmembrane domain-containing protein, partial [Bacteroidota bacterium]|nr:lysylphosphatidylglycerol synthase transmembrane domain-containing protein [Bacteroidota bacterium]